MHALIENKQRLIIDGQGRICVPFDEKMVPLSSLRILDGGPYDDSGDATLNGSDKAERFAAEFRVLCEKYDASVVRASTYDSDDNPVGEDTHLVVDGIPYWLCELVPDDRLRDS